MSGILNSKQRFVDTVLTAEGRRQLASGEFRIEFATFSDNEIFYAGGGPSGSIDLSSIIQLEASPSLPTDIITLETNLFGNVVSSVIPGLKVVSGSKEDDPKTDGPVNILDGKIVQFTNSGSKNLITGSAYDDLVEGILSSSIGNFNRIDVIGTTDPLSDNNNFDLSGQRVVFDITDKNVESVCALPRANLARDAESIYQDRRLSHLDNFKYLPPRNKATPSAPTGSILYNYPNNNQSEMLTFEDLENEIRFLPSREIHFEETSMGNNIICQLFEVSGEKLTKLSAIDFGEFNSSDPARPTKRFFFAGKIFPTDKFGTKTYANMFTLEFD
tara:strand:- start:349 stop:1338 length:990 start_codon:yes stop_codon:yes gene_type:complete